MNEFYRGYSLELPSFLGDSVYIWHGGDLVDEQPSVEAAKATIDTWMGGSR